MASRTQPAGIGRPATKREAAAHRRGEKSWFDRIPGTDLDEYLGPWLVAFLVVPALGYGGHRIWGDGLGAWILPVVFILAAPGLGWMTWREAGARDTLVRARAAVSVGGMLVVLGIHAHVGVFTRPWWDTWGVASFLLCLSWNIRRTEAVKGDGTDGHDLSIAKLFGDEKVTGRKVKSGSDDRAEFALSHPDAVPADLAKNLGRVAARLGVAEGAVRLIRNPLNAGKSRLVVMRRDVLAKPMPWPGPSAPGQSCSVPAVVGKYEDGELLRIVRAGDPKQHRNTITYAVAGMTGAGKTEAQTVELAELITRTDVVIWWMDTAKAGQTVLDFRPAIDWLAATTAQARSMVHGIQSVVAARSAAMGARGLREWSPGCGFPFILVAIEEAATVMEDIEDILIKNAATVRSVGIGLNISTQRWSSTQMPTDLRSNMGGAWCFGVKRDEDAAMILSEETLDSGATPQAWKNTKPGYCYLETPLVPDERWSMPARTFRLPAEDLRAHVIKWVPQMATLDAVTAMAAGTAYAKRERSNYMHPEFLRLDRGPVQAEIPMPTDTEEPPMDSVPPVPDDITDVDTYDDGNDPASATGLDLSDALTPGEPLSTEDRQKAFDRIVFDITQGGTSPATYETGELVNKWLDVEGMRLSDRPSLHTRLRTLADQGHAESPKRGTWVIHPSAVTASIVTGSDA